MDIFLIGQNRSTNQRAGMNLKVQIQNFGARACSELTNDKAEKEGQHINYVSFLALLL